MESWRELALKLFPEWKGIYEDPAETVWSVISDLQDQVVEAHESNNIDLLKKSINLQNGVIRKKKLSLRPG